jgi:mannose-1-phosphate guanylyltransferase
MSTPVQKVANSDSDYAYPGAESSPDRVALLLAGGDGMRLQELTNEIVGTPIPKQYCRLLNGISLLEAAIFRARLLFPRESINVVINSNHLNLAKDQLKTLPISNVFIQPMNRDTGPGIIFSLLNLERCYGDAMVAVFPTDHYIDRNWAFNAHVMRAINAISDMPDKIGVLGAVPNRLETGYGYILPAEAIKTPGKAYHVKAFAEKPNSASAREIIARGGLWNTFVMVFRLSRMLELLRQLVPREVEKLSELRDFPDKAAEIYQAINPWNFSTQVLAHIPEHLIVFQVANVLWSDWGTRESIERTYKTLKLVPFWKMSKGIGSKVALKEPAEQILRAP